MRIDNFNYIEALAKGWFKTATEVWLENLPLVTALPDMPAATNVWLENLPLVSVFPKSSKQCAVYINGRKG